MLRIPNGCIGRCIDDRHQHTSSVGTSTGNDAATVGVVGIGHTGIQAQPFAQVVLHGSAEIVALEVRLLDDTVLTGITAAEMIAEFIRTVGNLQLIVLHRTRAEGLLFPVRLVGQVVGQFHQSDFVLQFLILPGIEHLRRVVHLRERIVGVQTHLCHTFLTLLGADDDDTVGSTATVDSGRGGILQNLDVIDIVGREEVDILEGHAVHHIQRIVGTVQRSGTTHANGGRRTGLSVRLRNLQTGGLTLHTLCGTDDGTSFQVFRRDAAHGGGHVLTLHTAIADGHHFFEYIGLFLQHHLQALCGLHDSFFISDVGHLQLCSRLHFQRKLSVKVGHRPVTGNAHLYNRSTDNRFILGIKHCSVGRYALSEGWHSHKHRQ